MNPMRQTLLKALLLLLAGSAQALDLPSAAPLWTGTAYNDAVPATGAHLLHALGITGKGLTTAIFDDGFDIHHEALSGKIANAYAGPVEEHGTHVAGIALSMAPDSALWLEDDPIIDDGDNNTVFRNIAANAAQYGIVSFNNSWGDSFEGLYGSPAAVAGAYPLTAAAVQALLDAGVAVIGASGNASVNDRTSYPDGLPGVASAGALNPFGHIAAFSTQYRKPGLILLAPGVGIYSSGAGHASDYYRETGTSMAAPHVAGAVTLLKSGARAASAGEILAALYDSAAPVPYDGNALIPLSRAPEATTPDLAMTWVDYCDNSAGIDLSKYTGWISGANARLAANGALTADEWRLLNHMTMTAFAVDAFNDPANPEPNTNLYGAALFVKMMEDTGDLAPLAYTEYGFIQVDAAYRLLTARRSARMAMDAAAAGSAHAEALGAFSREMGLSLDQNRADLFQRLDGQPGDVLARAARQLGPGWIAGTMQSSVFGMLGLHAAAERRLERSRFPDTAQTTFWGEAFGGWHERKETRDGSGYHGSFTGMIAGVERDSGDTLAGGFAAWGNHNVRGDGASRGNWGTLSLYAGASRDRFSAGLSLSAGLGDYSLERGIDGPAASRTGMDYDAIRVHAKGDSRALSLSARGTAAWTLIDRDGWHISPGIEAAFAHTRMGGYTEDSGGGVRLSVRRHSERYAEAGAGLRASKTLFRDGKPFLTASAKAAGLYGASFGGAMQARFADGGTHFTVRPEHLRNWWLVPEASLTWNVSERVNVSASYQGRFGKGASVNTGSLSLGLDW